MEERTESRRFSILKPLNNDDDDTTSNFTRRKSELRRVSFSTFKDVKEFCPVSTVEDMTVMPDSTIPVDLSSSNTDSSKGDASETRLLHRTRTTWRDEELMEQTLVSTMQETADLADKENIVHHHIEKITKFIVSESTDIDMVDSTLPNVSNQSHHYSTEMELTRTVSKCKGTSSHANATFTRSNGFVALNSIAGFNDQVRHPSTSTKSEVMSKESCMDETLEIEDVGMDLTDPAPPRITIVGSAKGKEPATLAGSRFDVHDDDEPVIEPSIQNIQQITMDLTAHQSVNFVLQNYEQGFVSQECADNADKQVIVISTEKAIVLSLKPLSDSAGQLKGTLIQKSGPSLQANNGEPLSIGNVAISTGLLAQANPETCSTPSRKKKNKKKKKNKATEPKEPDVHVKRPKMTLTQTEESESIIAPSQIVSKVPTSFTLKRELPKSVTTNSSEESASDSKMPKFTAELISVVDKDPNTKKASEEKPAYSNAMDSPKEEIETEEEEEKEKHIELDGITEYLKQYKEKSWQFKREANILQIWYVINKSVQVDITLGPEYMERGIRNWVIDEIKLSTVRATLTNEEGRLALKLIENNPGAKKAALLQICDCTSKLDRLVNHMYSLIDPMRVFLNDDAHRLRRFCYKKFWNEDRHTLTMQFTHYWTESLFNLHMRLSDTFPVIAVETRVEILRQGSVKSKDITQLLQLISAIRAGNPYFCNVGQCVKDFLECLPRIM